MLQQMVEWEREWFLALNGSDSTYLDRFMWIYSGKAIWIPVAIFIVLTVAYKKDWRQTVLFLLCTALTIALADQFASHICKPYFTRFRPTHYPGIAEYVKTVFDYRGGKYGFISSHAANAFGYLIFTELIFRNKLYIITATIWAVLTAYSRIYLGVHFITDILFGMLAGIVFGMFSYWIYYMVYKKWLKKKPNPETDYGTKRVNMISLAIWTTIAVIAIFNKPLIALLLNT